MVLDNHPLMTPNTVLTDALNATLITMNGNENVLQNDMGNARVENAKLPPGYAPIGMKEYGGIIYVACYNPTTNKGQIGCFPSPQRQKTATQISEITPTFTFPDAKPIEGSSYYHISSLLTKCEIFPKGTIIRSGDKFSVGLPIQEMFSSIDAYSPGTTYISNYDNVENGLVLTPMNRMYTFGIATLDNNGQLRDITSQLKRFLNGQQIQFSNIDSDLYKFNRGYWANDVSSKNGDGIVSAELMDTASTQSKLNTYNSKLFGRLFLYAKYNIVDSVDISVVAYKRSDISNEIKNPISSNPVDNTFTIDKDVLLLIYANYKYNCPDGSGQFNGLVEPLEGYKYYFDKPNSRGIIKGLYLELTIGDSTTSSVLNFKFPSLEEYKYYNTGYSYPVYDSITNMYAYSQVFAKSIALGSATKIDWNLTPITSFYDQDFAAGVVPDKGSSGTIDTENINSGIMKLNTWNYYVDGNRINLRWGYESYPRDNDTVTDITFTFYDVANSGVTFNDENEIVSGTPRWTYITKNRLSYNGTFSESFDMNNFISEAPSTNIFEPNKLFLVEIKYWYNYTPKVNFRWMLLTGLYNPSYWGDDEYSAVQDYNDFLQCYYKLNGKYYRFGGTNIKKAVSVITKEGYSVVTASGDTVGGYQNTQQISGTWVEIEATSEESIEDIISTMQRIPSNYYNLDITATMDSSNKIKLTRINDGSYIFTDETDVGNQASTNEIYEANGTIIQTITLNPDTDHALKINTWTPSISHVSAKMNASITYEGEPTNKLNNISNNVANIKCTQNIITTTCEKLEFNTLFEGIIGECSIRQLSSLSTLPEFVAITESGGSGGNTSFLAHSYAMCVIADAYNDEDFYIDLVKIIDEKKYDTDSLYNLQHWTTNTRHSTDYLFNYTGLMYHSQKTTSNDPNITFREAFENFPQDYNVIILGTLAENIVKYIGDDSDDERCYSTTIQKLKRVSNEFWEAPNRSYTQSTTNYPGRMFILLRSISGEFTLVNYICDSTNKSLSEMSVSWNKFMSEVIQDNYYYNPDNVIKTYAITSDQVYSNQYNVGVSYSISANVDKDIITKDYNNVLSQYPNYWVMKANIESELSNIKASDTICTIPSAKHLIENIASNNTIIYVNKTASGNTVYAKDSQGANLNETSVYRLNNNALESNKQLRIKDNMLYTQNITSKLKTYPSWGWNSVYDGTGMANGTVTLGGMPIITLPKITNAKGTSIT